MVGRGALGNPFVFEEINAYLCGGGYEKPPLEKRLELCIAQINLMLKYKDPHNAILEARKHTAWYTKGLRSAAAIRRMCSEISSFSDVERICEFAINENK